MSLPYKIRGSGNSDKGFAADQFKNQKGPVAAKAEEVKIPSEGNVLVRFQGVTGGTINSAGDFEAKGRAIFSDDNYKSLRPQNLATLRLQYALRLEGMNIGSHGIGGWGGDSLMGKNTRSAVREVAKREGLNYDQAVALVMDRAKNKLGLGSEAPYFNPKTQAFDRDKPVWVSLPKKLSSGEQVKWSEASIYKYENERKHGPRRERLEKVWEKQIEPALVKNSRSEDFINKSKEHFFKAGAKYIREGSETQKKTIADYVSRVKEREARFGHVKEQWDKEVLVSLKKKDVSAPVIAEIKKGFFGQFAHDYIYARNEADALKGYDIFIREKNWLLSWNPKGDARVA